MPNQQRDQMRALPMPEQLAMPAGGQQVPVPGGPLNNDPNMAFINQFNNLQPQF